ncbi:MAG TPA: DUF3048 domain-containing protein [Mycobacteriales bacterium]|nr:DUF3048 domain-containing protein [Mycobacteriales bacterium]
MRTGRVVAAAAVLLVTAGCYAPPHSAPVRTPAFTTSAAPTTHRAAPHHPRRTHRPHRPAHHRRPHPRPPRVNPLSGRKPVPTTPVVAVKIDDTAAGRPQTNINAADVVYVEQVEAGLTRLLAVYSDALPSDVGPVRSVRYSDLELLRQYGRIALAYSGGAAAVVDAVHRADVIDSGAQRWGDAYYRSGTRPMPYNLMANARMLGAHVGKFARVRDIGLRWAARDRRFRRPVHSFSTVVGQTPVGFVWHAGLKQWIRRIGGSSTTQSDGAAVSTPNVIIQSCLVAKDARDVDVDGSASSYTRTVGSGRAIVFSGGRMIDGKWSRRSASAPTHYTDKRGRDIRLRPGGVWVLLVARGAPVSIR